MFCDCVDYVLELLRVYSAGSYFLRCFNVYGYPAFRNCPCCGHAATRNLRLKNYAVPGIPWSADQLGFLARSRSTSQGPQEASPPRRIAISCFVGPQVFGRAAFAHAAGRGGRLVVFLWAVLLVDVIDAAAAAASFSGCSDFGLEHQAFPKKQGELRQCGRSIFHHSQFASRKLCSARDSLVSR